MKKLLFLFVAMVFAAGLLACSGGQTAPTESASEQKSPAAASKLAGTCEEPRPEICTREYLPVCGYSEAQQRTYSNACTACADPAVEGWTREACEQ